MNVQRAGCFPLTTRCFEDLFVLALFLGLWTRRQKLFDRVMLPSASCHYQADSTSQGFFFVQGKKSCRVVDHFFVFAFRVVMLFFSEVKTLVDTSRLSSSYGHMEYIALHILSIHSPLGMLLLLSISDCFKEMASFPYQTSSALSILCVFSLF